MVVIRNRKTGEALRYTVSDDWLPKMLSWNKLEPKQRLDAAFNADQMFTVEADSGK